ncbi:hypothetical protein B0T14DRAFT_557080 [Immersiella caudata]|uniref:Uncharacterized protein n=1 Tax=Immersiella caudata TaxID=314043 RepID=A0AA39WDQ4_9PEZI|nr:hypothetical protein B0T14DRAFT_557080 [Immersiella caudata]
MPVTKPGLVHFWQPANTKTGAIMSDTSSVRALFGSASSSPADKLPSYTTNPAPSRMARIRNALFPIFTLLLLAGTLGLSIATYILLQHTYKHQHYVMDDIDYLGDKVYDLRSMSEDILDIADDGYDHLRQLDYLAPDVLYVPNPNDPEEFLTLIIPPAVDPEVPFVGEFRNPDFNGLRRTIPNQNELWERIDWEKTLAQVPAMTMGGPKSGSGLKRREIEAVLKPESQAGVEKRGENFVLPVPEHMMPQSEAERTLKLNPLLAMSSVAAALELQEKKPNAFDFPELESGSDNDSGSGSDSWSESGNDSDSNSDSDSDSDSEDEFIAAPYLPEASPYLPSPMPEVPWEEVPWPPVLGLQPEDQSLQCQMISALDPGDWRCRRVIMPKTDGLIKRQLTGTGLDRVVESQSKTNSQIAGGSMALPGSQKGRPNRNSATQKAWKAAHGQMFDPPRGPKKSGDGGMYSKQGWEPLGEGGVHWRNSPKA